MLVISVRLMFLAPLLARRPLIMLPVSRQTNLTVDLTRISPPPKAVRLPVRLPKRLSHWRVPGMPTDLTGIEDTEPLDPSNPGPTTEHRGHGATDAPYGDGEGRGDEHVAETPRRRRPPMLSPTHSRSAPLWRRRL